MQILNHIQHGSLTIILCFFSWMSFAQEFTLIKNVHIWNGTGDDLQLNQDVLIQDNLIKEIGSGINHPEAQVIEGGGRTMIPGLSDAHVHLSLTENFMNIRNRSHWMYASIRAAKAAENFLMLGFTTVRDLGGPVFGLQQAIDEGLVPGPRIYPCGAFISQTSGHGDFRNPNEIHPFWAQYTHPMEGLGWSYMVDGEAEVLKAARENLKNGATQLKVMAGGGISSDFDPIHSLQFTSEELEAAVKAAKDWDTYVTVHIYTAAGIIRALRAGVQCIDHGHLIDEEAIKLLKEKDAWLVPQSYWSLSPDPDPEIVGADRYEKIMAVRAGAIREMELAKQYDVNLAFGSDAFGPLGGESRALTEFTSRARWYEPVELLRQATSDNARLFNLSGKLNPYTKGALGVIEPGAYADLLIYEGNPLEDIQVIVNYEEHLKFIMKDGHIFKNELQY